jgi:ribose 5-phosphate isomerase B
MKIAITTDHAGFDALREIKEYLLAEGHEIVDFGPCCFDAEDDYPDLIFPAAQAVAAGEVERAIIMGGSGQGEAIAANRFKGVRCALFYGPVKAKAAIDASGTASDDPFEIVRLSRTHNNANVLSLSGRFMTLDEMKQAIAIWLSTPFTDKGRHLRRTIKLNTFGEGASNR